MKTVCISRRLWGRGKSGGHLRRPALEPDAGKQCCLGFICKAYGLTNADIEGHGLPRGLLTQALYKLPRWLYDSSHTVEALSSVNDDDDHSDVHRESEIVRLCLPHNVRIIFTK